MLQNQLFSWKNVMLMVCIGVFSRLDGQSLDTLWFDHSWKPTVKEKAYFFRPPVTKQGELFLIKDFYLNGQLQMEGLSRLLDENYFEGEVIWYNEDGSIYQQASYTDNKRNGTFDTYTDGKKSTAFFERGQHTSGTYHTDCGSYWISIRKELGNETTTQIFHGGNIEGLRYEYEIDTKGLKTQARYYNHEGKLISQVPLVDGYRVSNGIEVHYTLDPFRISRYDYYGKGKLIGSTEYYFSGTLFKEFQQDPPKTTFYYPDGRLLGELTYIKSVSGLSPAEGQEFFLNSYYDSVQYVNKASTYKNGQLSNVEMRYPNQQRRYFKVYDGFEAAYSINYDEQGNEQFRLNYERGVPHEGTERVNDVKTTYHLGKVTSRIRYYKDTNIPFAVLDGTKETYYDLQNNPLGTLTYEDAGYLKPLNGTQYHTHGGEHIHFIQKYENGQVIEETSSTRYLLTGKVFKKIVRYNPGDRNKVREIKFYSNGKVQSEIEFNGYKERKGTFYNQDGEMMATYDYEAEDGTRYQFFTNADHPEVIEQLDSGRLVSLKKYWQKYESQAPTHSYHLIQDIQANSDAKFYNREGELIAKASMIAAKPWEGTVYDERDRAIYGVKEGLRHGTYTKYRHPFSNILEKGTFANDKKQGLFTYYDASKGHIIKTVTYDQNLREGATTFYDEAGKITSTLTYKEDRPYDGVFIGSQYLNKERYQETYKEGVLLKRVTNSDEGKQVTTYNDGYSETISYYPTGEKKYEYKEKNGWLDGEVTRYDPKGNAQYIAQFNKGQLEYGRVKMAYINPRNYYDNTDQYLLLDKDADKMTVKLMQKDGTIFFEATEKWDETMNSNSILSRLDITPSYIRPKSLK